MAKASKEDIETTRTFMQAAEDVLLGGKFGLADPADNWEDWDDEDDEKILMLKLRKRLAEDEGCEPEEVDNRILMYEFLQHKYRGCDSGWFRVVWGADILIDNCTDPFLDYLDWRPDLTFLNVAPEQ